jgi:hypothetical protein
MKVNKKCLWCGITFEAEGRNCTRRNYCCPEHRVKDYSKKYYPGAKFQRDYLDKRRLLAYGIDNLIQCQICKKWFRQVGTHVVETHGITAREYREAYGFDVRKGQLPEDYKELKHAQAIENGMDIRLQRTGVKTRFKKGQKGLGLYNRSPQTMARLKNMKHLFKKKGGAI